MLPINYCPAPLPPFAARALNGTPSSNPTAHAAMEKGGDWRNFVLGAGIQCAEAATLVRTARSLALVLPPVRRIVDARDNAPGLTMRSVALSQAPPLSALQSGGGSLGEAPGAPRSHAP